MKSRTARPPPLVRQASRSAAADLPSEALRNHRSCSVFYHATVGHLRATAALRLTPAQSDTAASAVAALDADYSEAAATYRRLAVRVIERAFRDLTAPACGTTDRESAREFLAGSPMLFHWCSVAELDPCRVVARATTLRKGPTNGT